MKIDLPDETVRGVEAIVARTGGDVAAFVDQAVRRTLFFETARQVRERNADLDPAALDDLINREVAAARTERGEPTLGADRS